MVPHGIPSQIATDGTHFPVMTKSSVVIFPAPDSNNTDGWQKVLSRLSKFLPSWNVYAFVRFSMYMEHENLFQFSQTCKTRYFRKHEIHLSYSLFIEFIICSFLAVFNFSCNCETRQYISFHPGVKWLIRFFSKLTLSCFPSQWRKNTNPTLPICYHRQTDRIF